MGGQQQLTASHSVSDWQQAQRVLPQPYPIQRNGQYNTHISCDILTHSKCLEIGVDYMSVMVQ